QFGGAAIGGILGGLAGSAIGGNRTGAVIGALAGAAAGYFLGGAIANALSNPADRQKASTATQKVLEAPAPATYQAPPTTTNRAARQPRQTRPVQATWRSDSNNAISGTSTLTSVQRGSDGNECRTVREVAYVQGKEVQQD